MGNALRVQELIFCTVVFSGCLLAVSILPANIMKKFTAVAVVLAFCVANINEIFNVYFWRFDNLLQKITAFLSFFSVLELLFWDFRDYLTERRKEAQ